MLTAMEPLRMRGLVAAVVTPMNGNGDLNLRVVPQVVDYLVSICRDAKLYVLYS